MKTKTKSATKSATSTAVKSAPKSSTSTAVKSAPKSSTSTAVKSAPKSSSKGTTKAASKSTSKSSPKISSKSVTKAPTKTTAKTSSKTTAKRGSDKLSTQARQQLRASDFGIPESREYPMPDAQHVHAAESYFRYASEKEKAQLAHRIMMKAKKFGVSVESDTVKEWAKKYKN